MDGVRRSYPLRDVALYNGVTLLHFGLAAVGLLLTYDGWPALAWVVAIAYLVVALGQMYVVMPLRVCVACVYATMPGARCVSGLNLVAARLRAAPPDEFAARRTKGALSHNKLYMGSLIAPIPLLAAGLVLDFSAAGLAILLCVAALLAFRVLVVFRRTACPRCAAKGRCPNAKSMGIV
ncbi:MAG TPA: hypothetical protein VK576_02585 [Thermoleophilia bacterium]|nr:hypothetical protein [Thermoleophilia bacterium]